MENKNERLKNIIIVILIIMIIGLAGLMCYDKFVVKKESEKPASTTEKKEEPKVEEKEVDVTDQNLKKDLSDKVAILDKTSDTSYPGFGRSIYSLEKLTDSQKLRKVLMGSGSFNEEITEADKKASYDSAHLSGKASVKNIEEVYEKLFGSKIKSYDDESYNEKVGGCPLFEYNKTNNAYYLYGDCTGLPEDEGLMYINKITQKGNEAYVYVNVGTLYHDYNNGGKKIVYDGITKKVVISTDAEDNYKIDETNYTKFSEYKYTFTKDDTGNYYFTKIEKVNK